MKELLDWQKEGVAFLLDRPAILNNEPHRYLNDEMGLGKTCQACVAIRTLKPKFALYITPASLRTHWAFSLQDWGVAKKEDIFVIRSGTDVIPETAKHIIVSYHLTDADNIFNQLIVREFGVILIDEAQALQSALSNRSNNILGQKGKGLISRGFYKFLLSGTAATDRVFQLFPVLKTLAPQCIRPHTSEVGFGKYFCNGFHVKGEGWNFKGASHVVELRERMRPFLLRRTLAEVMPELPPYVYKDVFVEVKLDKDIHDTALPTLRRLTGVAKVPAVVEYVKERMASCKKLIIFAYHTEVIALLVEQLSEFGALPITGKQNEAEKTKAKEAFCSPFALHRNILVIQRTAGGTGMDGLQTVCNVVVEAEPDWTPGTTWQNSARIRRMMQTKVTFVESVIARNTCDDTVIRNHNKKVDVLVELFEPMEKMMLEQQLAQMVSILERIAVALEKQNTGETKVDTKPKSTPKTEAPKNTKAAEAVKPKESAGTPEGPTRDDASAALREVLETLSKTSLGKDGAKQAAIDVVKNIGKAEKLAEVAADKLAAVIAGFHALVESTSEDASSEDDGV